MCVCGASKWVNLSGGGGSAEKFYKGKSKTNFPLTILIRIVEGFLQFVGSIHNSGWDINQLGQHSSSTESFKVTNQQNDPQQSGPS